MKRLMSVFVTMLALSFIADAQTAWKIDRTHSNLDFSVRYMMLSNVRGNFTDFNAVLLKHNDNFDGSEIEVTVNSSSINTHNDDRDNHLKSDDFFDSANHPEIMFVSREFRKKGDNKYKIIGDLTIRGVTKEVALDGQLVGIIDDPRGFRRAAFTAATSINRNDFGVQWNRVLEAGGFTVGETVTITINAQFIKQS